ncbi:peptidoglycan recognition protein family protein [Thermoflavimicrobium dichotomicum]|uniref:N-acetylmuramoyl-L-alanine amidase n=1 Tax=Thermoflavimicrobium dichotomicum TaxID=46223 RepID=A0A1I3TGD3_9BACL|nr:N-acetylmuramoyl-L-alanine amidase [Thermoflavimicrobium dichotomicum]SFJ68706.1 N-acetylmuramoyl-L-alanine amidase [Thermoflavimicrobium dichotomicum]
MNKRSWRGWLTGVMVTSLALTGIPLSSKMGQGITPAVYAEVKNADYLQNAFAAAAKEFQVPERILLSVSYHVSRWEHHNGEPSVSGGYGLMHLTDVDQVDLRGTGKGDVDKESMPAPTDPSLHTLDEAARLLGLDPEELKKDPKQNIRGAAALLAKYARDTVGKVPAEESNWYSAVAKYSGSKEAAVALDFADQVFSSINNGVERQTTEGYKVRLTPKKVQPKRETVNSLNLRNTNFTGADCPISLACRFIPAAYEQRSQDPSDYGNYDLADRPKSGLDIRYIVIHDTEGSYQSAINWFANPAASASAQYVIRSADGQVTQMVNNKHVAWQAGNWYFNMHSIGLEHEGYAMKGATWYNEQLYRASAKLVRYLARKYDIPLDRSHIIGHDEIPGTSPARQSAMHSDPGPFWDWEHYMELVGAPITPAKGIGQIVTIKPHFRTNKPPVEDAEPQPANFVYLHTAPDQNAPLLDDPALSGPGTRKGLDWGDKAVTGQTYYVADRQGDWVAIWYGGQKAWFHNPKGKNTVRGKGILITPKAGKTEIPVYGVAYPEASAYPEGISPAAIVPLQYKITAGQIYVASEKVKGDYYYAKTFTLDPAATHKVIIGKEEYYRIQFNHRHAFVKASDVEIVGKNKKR